MALIARSPTQHPRTETSFGSHAPPNVIERENSDLSARRFQFLPSRRAAVLRRRKSVGQRRHLTPAAGKLVRQETIKPLFVGKRKRLNGRQKLRNGHVFTTGASALNCTTMSALYQIEPWAYTIAPQ